MRVPVLVAVAVLLLSAVQAELIAGGQLLIRTDRVLTSGEISILQQLGLNVTRHYSSEALSRSVLSVDGVLTSTTHQMLGSNVVLERDVDIAYPTPDGNESSSDPDSASATASWALDRIDQRSDTLDSQFTPWTDGADVDIFIVDTGVDVTHPDFGGRARQRWSAFPSQNDCDGHGTHVAGLAAGSTWGVARSARIQAIRVLDCSGSGTVSGLVQGLMWVYDNRTPRSIVSLSLGLYADISSLREILDNLYAAGVVIVAAAGNSNLNGCGHYPSAYSSVISVGASTASDTRASFSNYGSCVELFSPGENIKSTWLNGGTKTLSGTSMATPLVTGGVALLRSAGFSAEAARQAISDQSTMNHLSNLVGSPNRLLYVGAGAGTKAPSPSATPSKGPASSPAPNSGSSGSTTTSSASLFACCVPLILTAATMLL